MQHSCLLPRVGEWWLLLLSFVNNTFSREVENVSDITVVVMMCPRLSMMVGQLNPGLLPQFREVLFETSSSTPTYFFIVLFSLPHSLSRLPKANIQILYYE